MPTGSPFDRNVARARTYASLLIAQGESLAYVRDQLDHASIQITVDAYRHLVPGGNQVAISASEGGER